MTLKKLLQKNIGFEFEIATNLKARKLKSEFNKATGWKCVVDHDGSIEAGSMDAGWEIKTPPTPAAEAIKKFRKACKFFQTNEVKTNYSTGLHVNMSFRAKGYNYDMDPAKIQVLVDDLKWLKRFNRMENEYCESPKFFITQIKDDQDKWSKDRRRKKAEKPTAETIIAAMEQYIDDGDSDLSEKYCAVNLTHLDYDDNPYIEFRCLGGPSYHWRVKEIEKAITDFSKAMDQSLGNRYDYLMKRYINRICDIDVPRSITPIIPH